MEEEHWWFASRNYLLRNWVRGLNIPHARILDAGSGTGSNLDTLGAFGDTYGLDVADRAITTCVHHRKLRSLIQSDAQHIGYQDGTFDLITCMDVLEHVERPLEALRELKRVLRTRGRMLLTVPAFKFLWGQSDIALAHLRRYERRELRLQLEAVGFQVETLSYVFFAAFFIVAPIRLIRKLFVHARPYRSGTTMMPPRPLNQLLKWIFRLEAKLSFRVGLPVGMTLCAVVSKPMWSDVVRPSSR